MNDETPKTLGEAAIIAERMLARRSKGYVDDGMALARFVMAEATARLKGAPFPGGYSVEPLTRIPASRLMPDLGWADPFAGRMDDAPPGTPWADPKPPEPRGASSATPVEDVIREGLYPNAPPYPEEDSTE